MWRFRLPLVLLCLLVPSLIPAVGPDVEPQDKLSPAMGRLLEENDAGPHRIWVFFADKGLTGRAAREAAIAAAVGGQALVTADGGVRTGYDVLILLALGAVACSDGASGADADAALPDAAKALDAAPTADAFGNAHGLTGPAACGLLGFALADSVYAEKVIVVTDNLVPFPWGRANIGRADPMVTTEMQHQSNLLPWQLLARE